MSSFACGLVWLRRDLRLTDHAALAAALAQCQRLYCAFVFDRSILDPLIQRGQTHDRRVEFILASLNEIDRELRALGGALEVMQGDPCDCIPELAARLSADAVFAARDYEPATRQRDQRVGAGLAESERALILVKDQLIFHEDDILTGQGQPFSVFTPYSRAWMKALGDMEGGALDRMVESPHLAAHDTSSLARHLAPARAEGSRLPTLADLGFSPSNFESLPIAAGAQAAEAQLDEFIDRVDQYGDRRDYPALRGPSYLSVHLRFGTLSIRQAMRAVARRQALGACPGAATWMKELVWREFYAQILYHRPDVVAHAYRAEYDAIQWEAGAEADERFAAWCAGATGYPLVDAAMLQLNQTGYMHNRLRMVAASFLVKDLGIDWRRGEDYFALHLNDFDLASNNGGWQWAASTGCDAQPYFRIFNPVTQSERFDPEGAFIRRYLPQLARLPAASIHWPLGAAAGVLAAADVHLGDNYPRPIVDHAAARLRTLDRFAVARQSKPS